MKLLIPLFLAFIAACISPSPKPYALQAPIAQSGSQHILLGQPMDVNTADVTMLEALSGIGPILAQRIVEYRNTHGPFRSTGDLRQVPGIGDRMASRLAPWLRAGLPSTSPTMSKP